MSCCPLEACKSEAFVRKRQLASRSTHAHFKHGNRTQDDGKEVLVWMDMLSAFFFSFLERAACILACMTVVVGKENLLLSIPKVAHGKEFVM